MRSRLLYLAPVAAAALLTLACGRTPEATAQAASADTAGTPSRPVDVTVSAAVARDVPLVVTATGSFAADEVSDVAPETSGRVAQALVDVGDRVARGAVIARLNEADAALRLDQATAGLMQSEAALSQARERHALARANAARYDALMITDLIEGAVNTISGIDELRSTSIEGMSQPRTR